jgi:deazaflavin-dependent oxidoreductase (nitroreductase family)
MTQTVRRRLLRTLSHTLNPITIRIAKSGHGPFSLLRHVGRRSGRTYETPLILATAPEGFIAELTYGDTVDWYRNVVAGGGVVVRHRIEYRIDAVEPCDVAEGRAAFPWPARMLLRLLRRRHFRRLRATRR